MPKYNHSKLYFCADKSQKGVQQVVLLWPQNNLPPSCFANGYEVSRLHFNSFLLTAFLLACGHLPTNT